MLKDWASVGRLDWIVKQHDMAYSLAKNLRDTWKADTKMISFTKKDKNKTKHCQENHENEESVKVVK